MEEIAGGQRIRAYKVSGFDGKEWRLLSGGSAIGHKKIDFFAEKTVSRIRVEILRSEGEPLLRRLSVFYVGEIPASPRSTSTRPAWANTARSIT